MPTAGWWIPDSAGTIATPGRHKRIYDVFRAADGPKADEAFRFALPVIGIQSWEEIAKPK